jgi:hypothetical protein
MSKSLASIGGGHKNKGQSSGGHRFTSPGFSGTLGGGDKKQTGGRSSKKSSQDARADAIRKDLLAGMPNMSKVPTLDEWRALFRTRYRRQVYPQKGPLSTHQRNR